MSYKSTAIAAFAIIALLVLSFFAGRWTKPDPLIVTETIVKTDTVIIWRDAEIKIVYREKPVTEISPMVFAADFDTTVVLEKDSVFIKQEITFDSKRKVFTNLLDLDLKKMEAVIIDSLFITKVKEVEVPAEQPFYDTFLAGSIFTIILIAIIAVFL